MFSFFLERQMSYGFTFTYFLTCWEYSCLEYFKVCDRWQWLSTLTSLSSNLRYQCPNIKRTLRLLYCAKTLSTSLGEFKFRLQRSKQVSRKPISEVDCTRVAIVNYTVFQSKYAYFRCWSFVTHTIGIIDVTSHACDHVTPPRLAYLLKLKHLLINSPLVLQALYR